MLVEPRVQESGAGLGPGPRAPGTGERRGWSTAPRTSSASRRSAMGSTTRGCGRRASSTGHRRRRTAGAAPSECRPPGCRTSGRALDRDDHRAGASALDDRSGRRLRAAGQPHRFRRLATPWQPERRLPAGGRSPPAARPAARRSGALTALHRTPAPIVPAQGREDWSWPRGHHCGSCGRATTSRKCCAWGSLRGSRGQRQRVSRPRTGSCSV